MTIRCTWCGDDPQYVDYHDQEWGVPQYDDRRLFEFLILEGAQAGLSWSTILRKRENYRKAFHDFEINKIAAYTERDIERLLADPGIVRNRLKIMSAVRNAKAVMNIQEQYGSLSAYLWHFVDGTPIQNEWRSMADIPTQTELSDRISKDLKTHGLNFVGSTIVYAFMQAVGMVNDHTKDCFRYKEITNRSKGR